MAVTYYTGNMALNKFYGRTDFTPPATLFFGLSTTAPAIDGTNVTEPVGSNYARVGIANNKTSFTTAQSSTGTGYGPGYLSNAVAIQFPESSGSWGVITHVVIFDAATSGNVLFYEALTQSKTVESSTTVLIAANAATFQMLNS